MKKDYRANRYSHPHVATGANVTISARSKPDSSMQLHLHDWKLAKTQKHSHQRPNTLAVSV